MHSQVITLAPTLGVFVPRTTTGDKYATMLGIEAPVVINVSIAKTCEVLRYERNNSSTEVFRKNMMLIR